ncbi:hypothetical protein MHYP_G00194430 [Metynnis hypsauchen]
MPLRNVNRLYWWRLKRPVTIGRKMVFPRPPQELLNKTTALVHAEKLLRAEGIPAPSHQLCLGKLVEPFGHELLGLEYLFSQSLGESFCLQDVVNDGPSPEEKVVHPEQPDPVEAEEAYHSDVEAHGIALDDDLPHITLTSENFSLSGLCEKLCVLLKFFTVQ